MPKIILNKFHDAIKPLFKDLNVLKPDVNLLSFLCNDFIYRLQNETIVLCSFGFTYKIKSQVIGVEFMVALYVQVHFVKINFELNLFPANFTVGFWVSGCLDASSLFFRRCKVLVCDVLQMSDDHVVVVNFLRINQFLEDIFEQLVADLVFLLLE